MDVAKSALFRFDAGPSTGGGHAVRCLTLADALEAAGWRCRFAVNAGTLETVPALAERTENMVVLSENVDGQPEEMAAGMGDPCHVVIIDHYGWDATLEAPCRKFAERVMVIDDLADRSHDCDLLLDQGMGRVAADYAALVPGGCRLILGPTHALLRPAYARLRAETLRRRHADGGVHRLLIAFGLTDPENFTATALAAVGQAGFAGAVDVVLGAAAPQLETVKRMIATSGANCVLHVDTDNMAELMAGADLSFGALGTTAWERCCLGLPCLAVTTADNQHGNATALASAGAVVHLGGRDDVDTETMAKVFKDLMGDAERRRSLVDAAAAVCDGAGVARVIEALADG